MLTQQTSKKPPSRPIVHWRGRGRYTDTENRNTSPFLLLFSNIGYRFYYNWWRAISWSWSAAEKWFWSILLKKMAPNWDLVPTKTSNEYRNLGRFFIFRCEFLESIAFVLDFNFILIFTLWRLWFCGLEIPSLDTMNFTFKIMKNGCMPTWHWLQNGLHHCSRRNIL